MRTTKYLLVVIVFLVFKTTFAQDGTLDPTFNSTGILLPNYGNLESENIFIKVQPDGRLITVETVSAHGSNPLFYLRRYDLSGFHDSSFGIGGVVTSSFNGLAARVTGVELQADGKVLIAGFLSGTGGGAFIGRYNSDGTMDLGFGINGFIIIAADYLRSFVLQPDGGILITYGFYMGDVKKMARISSDGDLDFRFGIEGSIDIPLQGTVRIQNGKILLVSGGNDFVFTRYLSSGEIDTAFGSDGTVTVNIDDTDNINSVEIQSDGKILFVANSQNSVTNTYRLVRLLTEGGLDSSFGSGGMVLMAMVSTILKVQTDGKIIVAGASPITDGSDQLAVSRFTTSGNYDVAFGKGGLVTTSLGNVRVGASSIEKIVDGKILVGGTICEASLPCNPHSFVVRYDTNQLSMVDFGINQNTFRVYPNPVNEFVNIDFNLTQSEVLSVDLLDTNGRKIFNLIDKEGFQVGVILKD